MTLDDVADVGRAILIELEMMSWSFLCVGKTRIKIEPKGQRRVKKEGDGSVPKIMTATSTEHSTPSS